MIYGDTFKELKSNLAKGELDFLSKYEPSIRELFKDLAKIGAIKMATTKEQADRMVKYRYTLNSPAFLHRNVIRFTELNKDEREEVISYLKERGFETNELGNQMFSIIAQNYHSHLEDLKLHFELFIDFVMICDLLGEGIPKFKSFCWMVKTMKKVCENNDFLDFLDSKVRNAIAHFTFFYYKNNIYFCNGVFDNDPIKREMSEFMIESKNFNILSLSFFHIYYEMFKS